MIKENNIQIKCSNCNTTIDVQDILAHQVGDIFKQECHKKEIENLS